MPRHNNHRERVAVRPHAPAKEAAPQRKPSRAPWAARLAPFVFFLLVWAWAALWMGDVFHVAREYSFWAPDSVLMRFERGVAGGWLWTAGRALLTLYKWPLVGGLLLAVLLSLGAWLLGFALRLRGAWRAVQYLPACLYMTAFTYIGFDTYYQAETGRILGLPLAFFAVVAVAAVVVRLFVKAPRRESGKALWEWGAVVVAIAVPLLVSHYVRPEVRVVGAMQRAMERQDWLAMEERARADADLSYRQIAAYYAVSLVRSGRLLDHLFDIRLDYDEPYLHAYGGQADSGLNYYQQDCDYHAGLVLTAIHHAMEQMTMTGPTLRALKLLTKCALLRSEWDVARKYLYILARVPFEGDFVEKYRPMVGHKEFVDQDPEMASIRQMEPLHDQMENNLVQPAFLGYNAALAEGRGKEALYNSLAVNIYTKAMPAFMLRCQALQSENSLPRLVGEALGVLSGKYPEVMNYPGMELYQQRFAAFAQNVAPYMSDRAAAARSLFPLYKGYYGYYYFFGNLKATKSRSETNTSRQGVN